MNHDSSSSDLPSSVPLPVPTRAADSTPIDGGQTADAGEAAALSTTVEPSPAKKRAYAQTKKKFEFINHLTLNLDVLIYAELSILYYMEYIPFPNLLWDHLLT